MSFHLDVSLRIGIVVKWRDGRAQAAPTCLLTVENLLGYERITTTQNTPLLVSLSHSSAPNVAYILPASPERIRDIPLRYRQKGSNSGSAKSQTANVYGALPSPCNALWLQQRLSKRADRCETEIMAEQFRMKEKCALAVCACLEIAITHTDLFFFSFLPRRIWRVTRRPRLRLSRMQTRFPLKSMNENCGTNPGRCAMYISSFNSIRQSFR